MISLFLALFLSPDLPPKIEQAPKKLDLSGMYEVRGSETRQDGKKVNYVALLIMKKISEDRYACQWSMGIGVNTVGHGYVRDGYLICTWKQGEALGITEYKLGEKGTHTGRYTHNATASWHEETIRYRMDLFRPASEDE